MFQRFFRGKNADGFRGTGIGLNVCMEFVKSHGGTIEIESQESVGSTFTVKLPIAGMEQTPHQNRQLSDPV